MNTQRVPVFLDKPWILFTLFNFTF